MKRKLNLLLNKFQLYCYKINMDKMDNFIQDVRLYI